MKILVTGASGFIGGKIVECFAQDYTCEISATSRSDSNRFNAYKNVVYIQHDLSKEIPEQNCEVCIHCAGLADDQSTEESFYINNIKATYNLLNALKSCKVVIYISSASVYDFSDGLLKHENDTEKENAVSNYGKSKLHAEELVKASGIPSIYILRPRAVYGPGDRLLLPRILGLIRMNRMIIPSTLAKKTSLTHVYNLCEVVNKAVLQSKNGIHVFNVADKMEYPLKSVFASILYRKSGGRSFITIPTFLLVLMIRVNSMLARKSQLSIQALNYLTHNSLLSVEKAERELDYVGFYSFYDSIGLLEVENQFKAK
jgi:nucleoside-diphosphate-sugar epimerase